MSLISPIQVVALRFLFEKDGKVAIVVGLSHQIKNFSSLDISLVDRQGNPVPFEVSSAVEQRSTLSNSWQINFDSSHVDNDKNSFTLSIATPNSATQESPKAETAGEHSLFRKFLVHIDCDRNPETDALHPTFELAELGVYPQANPLLTTLNRLVSQELENLKELIDFEAGL